MDLWSSNLRSGANTVTFLVSIRMACPRGAPAWRRPTCQRLEQMCAFFCRNMSGSHVSAWGGGRNEIKKSARGDSSSRSRVHACSSQPLYQLHISAYEEIHTFLYMAQFFFVNSLFSVRPEKSVSGKSRLLSLKEFKWKSNLKNTSKCITHNVVQNFFVSEIFSGFLFFGRVRKSGFKNILAIPVFSP